MNLKKFVSSIYELTKLDESPFILNHSYKRSQIHDQFGGNRQGGIAPSAKKPFIFIFSGRSGHQHGYKDQWENDNIYSYTGEGQISNMQFAKGNLAIRDHVKNKMRVFLFTEDVRRSYVKFQAELQLREFDFFVGPDKEGNDRIGIKFFFQRVGIELDYPKASWKLNVEIDPKNLLNINIPNETERKGLITSRVGQGAYRKSILYRWNFRCAVTNYSKNEILIASHILPWKEANNIERLDVNNGILLSPNYDALFDRHLISFENSGKIIFSEVLQKSNYHKLGLTGNEKISNLSLENYPYLEKHRDKLI